MTRKAPSRRAAPAVPRPGPFQGAGAPARSLLKDRAHEQLKALILDEALPPGAFLSERQLAERLRMSKTPVRSALERLEAEGLVSISPQQGVVVRELPVEEIVDLFDIRIALETFVARRLAGRLDAAQRARLEECLKAQADCVAAADGVGATRLDAEFHLLLGEFLGNREISRVLWRLRDKLYRVILRIHRQDAARIASSHREHRRIAEAILAGDPERAAERVAAHLEYGKRFLVER